MNQSIPAESELWRAIFRGDDEKLAAIRRSNLRWPRPPRCILCAAPFAGIGGVYFFARGIGRNRRNPRYCNACDKFIEKNAGGATVFLSMIMIDIRNSVALLDARSPYEAHRLLDGFYKFATKAVIETGGMIHELRGDCVFAAYPPGFCGSQHASKAIEAARLLLATPPPPAPDGSPVEIGIGVHAGHVHVCKAIGAEGTIQDVAMQGPDTNIVSRLSQISRANEALVSRQACEAAGQPMSPAEVRALELKGVSGPVHALVLRKRSHER